MTKTFKRVLAGLLAAPVLALSALVVPIAVPASAACDPTNQTLAGGAACSQPTGTSGSLFGSDSIFTKIVNILLFIIGAVAVIMLIIGGIRYTLSAGKESEVTAAKNTILYAIIGIVVAFLAYAVVNWVLTSLA
ncbi:hypothetical protein EPN95_02195 [Patescibacteria group bacterium]|nr:MAG: hypothetical protein EPN95_02195 [Patescibacteria group bacterium]